MSFDKSWASPDPHAGPGPKCCARSWILYPLPVWRFTCNRCAARWQWSPGNAMWVQLRPPKFKVTE